MNYVDMHAHMISRTTDDYQAMALTGCLAVSEPAFWPGWDRSSADGFVDYFRQLTEFEPRRAAQHGIQHYAWLCLNPKEGEDRRLAAEVLARIPAFLGRHNVVGIGEIGLNRVTRNELATFLDHVSLAVAHDQLILIHTPHLEDKLKGTLAILEALRAVPGVTPGRVLVDHAEEHTLGPILEAGCWAGITLYPQTKASQARAADMIEVHGAERVVVNSACDWGPSTPLAVPQFILEMRRRRHPEALVRRIVHDNPIAFLAQSPRCRLLPDARATAWQG
jgi:hypothetical protein